MKVSLWDIYKTFLKIGAILIGGGYVILPILKQEAIVDKNWLTEDELIDYYTISQSLPGLIAANISIFIGYKLKGTLGAIFAILGIISSPFICIVLLASVVSQLSSFQLSKVIFHSVGFGVIILVISSVKEMWSKAIVDKFSLILFLVFMFMILKLNVTPSIIIISSIFIGILYKYLVSREVLK